MNVLFVCSQNLLRSPTAEHLFASYPNIQTRSAGTDVVLYYLNEDEEQNTPRRSISKEDIEWADIIIAMENYHGKIIRHRFGEILEGRQLYILNIRDIYERDDPFLIMLLKQRVTPFLR